MVSLSFDSVTFPSFILLYPNLVTPNLERTLECQQMDQCVLLLCMTPADGCIYHLTSYLKGTLLSSQNVANHVSLPIKHDKHYGDPYKSNECFFMSDIFSTASRIEWCKVKDGGALRQVQWSTYCIRNLCSGTQTLCWFIYFHPQTSISFNQKFHESQTSPTFALGQLTMSFQTIKKPACALMLESDLRKLVPPNTWLDIYRTSECSVCKFSPMDQKNL